MKYQMNTSISAALHKYFLDRKPEQYTKLVGRKLCTSLLDPLCAPKIGHRDYYHVSILPTFINTY